MRKLLSTLANRPYALPLIGIAGLILVILVLVKVPEMAKSRLQQNLAEAGFRNAQVGDISIRPSSIIAENIKLDQYGFDEIKTLDADINWPAFLSTGKIDGLTIENVKLGRDAANLGAGAQQLISTLLNLPSYRIMLSRLTLDITTDFGEIRLTADATVNSDNNPAQRDIKARIRADQYQLSFDSLWQGSLNEQGELDLSATVDGGRLNAGPLRVSRFNGWIGAAAAQGKYSWQSQIEAGSATFMDVPLQNLSAVTEYKDGTSNAVFRSGISGIPDILFAADFTGAEGDAEDSFSAVLSGNNLGNFLDYIEETTGRKKIIRDTLVEAGPFEMTTLFESEKRFVGGPLPFSVALKTDGKKTMSGNLLIYPDTLDVRGSLETSADMAQALQDYFKIPATNMRQNYIRMDGDMRRFFYLGPLGQENTSKE